MRTKTKLSLTFDDQPNVLPPNTAKDVALYMGWYSVDKYVPACQFHPGAVGFHLASYTMVTLRRPDERCWVRSLLEDGVGRNLPDHRLADYLKHCALGRVGTFDEVARFAAFLVSDANSYMTGETVIMDGGL